MGFTSTMMSAIRLCISLPVILILLIKVPRAISSGYITNPIDCYTSDPSSYKTYAISPDDSSYVFGEYLNTPASCYMTFVGSQDLEVEFTGTYEIHEGVTLQVYRSRYTTGTPYLTLTKGTRSPDKFISIANALSIHLRLSPDHVYTSDSFRFTIRIKLRSPYDPITSTSVGYATHVLSCYITPPSSYETYMVSPGYTAIVFGVYSSTVDRCYMTFEGTGFLKVDFPEFMDFRISSSGVTLKIYKSLSPSGSPYLTLSRGSSRPNPFTSTVNAVTIYLRLSPFYTYTNQSFVFTMRIKGTSISDTNQPGPSTQQPGPSTQHPSSDNQQPSSGNQQPSSGNQQPSSGKSVSIATQCVNCRSTIDHKCSDDGPNDMYDKANNAGFAMTCTYGCRKYKSNFLGLSVTRSCASSAKPAGCSTHEVTGTLKWDSKKTKITTTECFCNGNFCNGSPRTPPVFALPIYLLVAIKVVF